MNSNNQKNERKPSKLTTTTLHKLILSLAAIVSIYVTSMNYAFNKESNSVKLNKQTSPSIRSLAIMDSSKKQSGIKLLNSGLGPALVKSSKVYLDGKKLIKNNSFTIKRETGLQDNLFQVSPLKEGDAIKEGDKYWLIQTVVNTPETAMAIRDFLHQASIVTCYCSLNKVCKSKVVGLKIETEDKC